MVFNFLVFISKGASRCLLSKVSNHLLLRPRLVSSSLSLALTMAPKETKVARKVNVRVDLVEAITDTTPVDEGHPAPPIASSIAPAIAVPCHRRSSLGPKLERSVIQEANLDRLRSMMPSLMTLE